MGTVLVVEDEATVREVVCAYLHRARLPTHEAADGLVAVRAFPDVRPDLVVLDLMIPGIDGFEVLRRCDLASVSGSCSPAATSTSRGMPSSWVLTTGQHRIVK
ncbi:response regulator [Serinicoccus marinus]|uniref:response regulator n=1 Tax=Serinicoccus marinus TaxID=247333 RepID=UPI0003B69DE9|nr:response regulator [Serinicoccus marinus]